MQLTRTMQPVDDSHVLSQLVERRALWFADGHSLPGPARSVDRSVTVAEHSVVD